MVRAIGRRAAAPVLDGEGEVERGGGCLACQLVVTRACLVTDPNWTALSFSAASAIILQKGTWCMAATLPQHSICSLKVRDVQSKMPEINTSHVWVAAVPWEHICTEGVTVSVGDVCECVIYIPTNKSFQLIYFPRSTGFIHDRN